MRKVKLVIILILVFHGASITANNNSLTKNQMLQDFDQAVNHINTFAVHRDLNAIRLQIDYDQEYKKLRNEITEETTECEFKEIIGRALGLVQDAHCSFMDSDYLSLYGKYQKKINFKDDQTYEKVKSYESKCDIPQPKLKLPLVYIEGKYFVYADFTYKGTLIKQNTEVTRYNGKNISDYLKANYDKVGVVRWDSKLKKPYKDNFYRKGDNQFQLGFNDKNIPILVFSLYDSIIYQTEKQKDIYYYSQP